MIKGAETAKQKVSVLMREEGFDPSSDYVRVGVKSGGCSGLSYELKFDNNFQEEDKLWSINQIEHKDGRLLKYCLASDIARASALRCDMVRVKLTMTRGEDSTADVLVVPAETTYTAGHLIELDDQTWRIRAIHTGRGRTLRGTV